MADKEHKEVKIGNHLTAESIKTVSEAVGIVGLPDDAATQLAEDCTYRLKQVVQVCLKSLSYFMLSQNVIIVMHVVYASVRLSL